MRRHARALAGLFHSLWTFRCSSAMQTTVRNIEKLIFEVNSRSSTPTSQAYALFATSHGNIALHRIFCSADFPRQTITRLNACAPSEQCGQTSTKSILEVPMHSPHAWRWLYKGNLMHTITQHAVMVKIKSCTTLALWDCIVSRLQTRSSREKPHLVVLQILPDQHLRAVQDSFGQCKDHQKHEGCRFSNASVIHRR